MPAPDPRLAVLIVNPGASRLRDAAVRERVVAAGVEALHRRGLDRVEVAVAADRAEVRAAAETAVAGGAAIVAVAGGDGTLRDASGPLAGSGVSVGVLPCGTGNLYAASVGIPRHLDWAMTTLATGTPHAHDVGEVRLERPGAPDQTLPFVVACGTGFDARVMEAMDRESKRRYGVAAYFLAASRLLEHLRPRPTVVTVDGVATEIDAVVTLIANAGGAMPGGLRPRLPVPSDDGLLHVFVLPRGGVLGGVRGVVELLLATSCGSSATGAGLRLTGQSVRVEVAPSEPVEVDGDPFGPGALEARIRPGALQVLRA